MLYALLDGRENEPSNEDGAMYHWMHSGNYVFEGVGNEFQVVSSPTSFQLTLGTGEGLICGHHVTEKMVSGESSTQSLSANSNGYVVIRFDRANNQALFTNTSTIKSANINDGGDYNDLVLYGYSTGSSGVTTWIDMRPITTGNNYYLTIENGELFAHFNGTTKKIAIKDI